ncbi:hypothetical protein F2P47_01455 [Parvibaculum sedimenti]|uniref:Uncharacterized protein n=1 Tax=Parvibaculum sedimenti TaxID=2608632 RepID=A0A6N6VM94_9HYPH|nr:hypothetical protein F2P47_01455 [Parvibaculum sedimenti]
MTSNARCWMPRLAVLAIAMSLLTACATAGSEPRIATVCPPVVEYSREFQARAAEELGVLPDGSAIAEMMSDYAVMRDQARSCRSRRPSAQRWENARTTSALSY